MLLRISLMVVLGAWAMAAPSRAGAEEVATHAAVDDLIRTHRFAEAVTAARAEAETGDLEGQFRLALFYWHGVGTTQNYIDALRWCTLAALANHKRALAARALMLPSIDLAQAPKILDWARQRLQKTAEGGKDSDIVAMSRSYSAAFGFENSSEQYFWAAIAVALGDASLRKERDAAGAKLAVADTAKAQDKAAAWIAKWRPAPK